MFTLVADESQQTQFGIHKKRYLGFQTGLLTGHAIHDSTTRDYSVIVEPNYDTLRPAKGEDRNRRDFNAASGHGIFMGVYRDLNVVDFAVRDLDTWYRKVLQETGAAHYRLVEDGNQPRLVSDNNASDMRLGDAIVHARTLQAFNLVNDNRAIDFKTMTSKIMPIFLHALGLSHYHLSHTIDEDGHQKACFAMEKVGAFTIHTPFKDGDPAYVERMSYINGNYVTTAEGPATGGTVRSIVFDWLVAAAREYRSLPILANPDLDTMTDDIRNTWVNKPKAEQADVPPGPRLMKASGNIIHLGQFR